MASKEYMEFVANTGEWEMDLSAKEFDTVEEAIEGIQNPDTLGVRLGYGETRHH